MANAIGCWFNDRASAEWVRDACSRELSYFDTDTHKYRFSCFELSSMVYEAWNWVAEVSAMTWIRQWKAEPCLDADEQRMLDSADAWVTRMLAHRAVMWAAQSRHSIEARRENGKIYWRGMGAYPAGLRAHPMSMWQGNQCGVAAVGLDPDIDKINPDGDLPYIIHACSDWGLGSSLSMACQALANGDLSGPTLAATGPYLVATRTSVPWLIRRYGQKVFTCATSHIEGGNTGALWGALLSGSDSWTLAYPYSSDRIRSGHPELGRGKSTGWGTGTPDPVWYRAYNLTEAEAEKPGKGPRLSNRIDFPTGTSDLELRLNVDTENKLYIREERWPA